MNKNITVIQADITYSDGIKKIISDVYPPIHQKNIERFGPDITNALDKRWQMPGYNTLAENNKILVASVDSMIVGFTAYRVAGDILMTDHTVSYDSDAGDALYKATLDIARENGCRYAKVHAVTDEIYSHAYGNYRNAGYNTGLESIMYYMPLSKRNKKKINGDIVIVPASESHIKEVEEITVKAWIPIRAEQKRLLGDKLYTRLFDGWEKRKCLEVKNDFLAGGNGGSFGYAALIDGKIAGFVTRLRNHAAPYMGIVGNNAVNPEYAGRGIGSAMYDHILGEMENDGMTYVGVYTGRDNAHAPARRAYERMGFDPAGAVCCADYYAVIE